MPNDIQWDDAGASDVQWDKPTTAATQPPPSMLDQLKRQLGLSGRLLYNSVTGSGQVLGDALVGGANAAFGSKLPLPSQAQAQMLNNIGVPQAETTLEKGVQFAGGLVGGALDPVTRGLQLAANKLAPSNFVSPSSKASQNVVAKDLHDAGYVLPPTEMDAGLLARGLEHAGDKSRVAQTAEFANQEVTQRLAKQALGMPQTERITGDALKTQADVLVKQGYDPVRAVPKISVGSSYRKELQQIKADIGGSNSFPLAQRDEVKQLVDKYLYTGETTPTGSPRVIQSYTGDDAINEISLLRKEASSKFARGDGLQGEAMRRIATALEDNIESSLKGQGSKLVGTFRTTREALAKNFAVERMLTDPNTGVINAAKAAQMLKAGTPLTGELNTIAKAGGPMFSRATGVPTGGKPGAFNPWEASMMAGGAGLSGLTGGGTLGLAAIPPARLAARVGVLSKPAQALMARNLTERPSIFGDAAPRIQAGMPPELLQLFGGQGEQQ